MARFISNNNGMCPLDYISGAAVAYSIRKLKSSSTNTKCMKVRRSSDNSELDIGFAWNESSKYYGLDETALMNFVGTQNLVTYSEDFFNASWSKTNSGSNSPSRAETNRPDPLGGTTATKWDFGEIDASSDYSTIMKSLTLTAVSYTGSVYVKAADAESVGKKFYIYFSTAGGDRRMNSITLTSSYQRLSITSTLTAASWYFVFGVIGSTLGGENQINISVDIWGAQVNTGSLIAYNNTGIGIGGNGFVTTWYDQLGVYNAINITAGGQPYIVNSGILNTNPLLPCIRPQAIGSTSLSCASFSISQPDTIIVIGAADGSASTRRFFDGGAGARQLIGVTNNITGKMEMYAGSGDTFGGSLPLFGTSNHIHIGIFNYPNTSLGYVDGSLMIVSNNLGSHNLAPLVIFSGSVTYISLSSCMSELIIFSGAISPSDRKCIEQNQSNFYNIPLVS